MKFWRRPAFLCVLLFLAPLASADDVRIDGNWWITQDRNEKLTYMIGLYDGLQLGLNFSTWKFFESKDPADKEAYAKANASFKEYVAKYAKNTRTDQLADGLDSFYGDYRNRRIKVWAGLWLVLNEIAGTPHEKMERMIEDWRKNATD